MRRSFGGALVARPAALPLAQLCAASASRGRWNLKRRLVAAGLKQPRCELCGLDSWRDRPLALALHHINGVRDDNRLDNLQLLCPNCHSQTETFAGRNARRRETQQEAAENAYLPSGPSGRGSEAPRPPSVDPAAAG
jgi:hypothetical protein